MTTYQSTRTSSGGGIGIGSGMSSRMGGGSYGGLRSSGSMYGGAGGRGVQISQASRSFSAGGGAGFGGGAGGYGGGYGGFGGGGGGGGGFGFGAGGGGGGGVGMEDSVIGNEKFTMQNLNDRLGNYLGQVAALERANAELEMKIRGFLENKAGPDARDYSAFYVPITNIQGQIQNILVERSNMLLVIDNTRLGVDDFRVKYENELSMRESVEADIVGLRGVFGDLGFATNELNMQIGGLMDEIAFMKKSHEEDMLSIKTTIGGQVNVEVDAAPQIDLAAAMQEMRIHYEALAQKTTKELEGWFQTKVEPISTEAAANQMNMQTSSSETNEMNDLLRSMEMELQNQLSMKASMEGTLANTQDSYSMILGGFQNQISSIEGQIMQARGDQEYQSQEYQMLLDIKSRLEMEIAEYRRLMDGGAISNFGPKAGMLSMGMGMGMGRGMSTGIVIGGGMTKDLSSSTSIVNPDQEVANEEVDDK